MPYDPLRHHRRSIRLPGYDYSQPRAYFVTICTKWRRPLFGSIVSGVMHRNQCGEIVAAYWHNIACHFAGVVLDAFIVMPDHVHSILLIQEDPPVGEKQRQGATLGQMVAFWKYQAAAQIDNPGRCEKRRGLAPKLLRTYYW